MLGVIVNTGAVLLGGSIGLLIRKGVPEKLSDIIMKALALCVLVIGIKGTLEGNNAIILIISMVVGTIIGQLADLDKRLGTLANMLENRFKKEGDQHSIAKAFTTTSLLYCVGALTIVGSLRAGLTGDNQMLFIKSGLDFISSIIFGATLGVGVLFSAGFVLIFQGSIVLLAQFISPYLGTEVVAEMTCAGSLLIIAMSLNMLDIVKIKVMNMLPAIFLPIALVPLYSLIERIF